MHVQAVADVVIKKPFKGLAQYRRDDPCPLFARDKDVELIESRLWSSRVTVMFAGSGVGKTSFLNARLIPALEEIYGPEQVAAPDPHSWARVDPRKELAAAKQKVSSGPSTRRGGIIILDQFEELFQHFPSPVLLRAFGEELSAIIDDDSALDIRLLISIREEFLAELTSLDDFLPGILTNYYRLRRLSRVEAKLIVEKTAELGGAMTHERVNDLVDDLCALDRGQRRDAAVFVDPPYLQIVCQRVWNRENPTAETPFLSSYKKGQAVLELEAYCREKLEQLSGRQAVLVRRALEHLTGPHEAKKFRRVAELATEIRARDAHKLAEALDVLEKDDVKILRRWEESASSAWATKNPGKPRQVYQLYHDMYAPELWRWKERRARLEWRRGLAKWLAVAAAVLFFVLWPATQRLLVTRAVNLPYGHADEYAAVLDMRNAFGRTVLFRSVGDRSWAQYTQKLATLSALKGDTDAAIAYRLAGLAVTAAKPDTDGHAFGSGRYLRGTLGGLRGVVDATLIDSDGQTAALVATVDGQLLTWQPGSAPLPSSLPPPESPEAATPSPAGPLQPPGVALAPKILCLSLDGTRALTARVASDPLGILLEAIDLRAGSLTGRRATFPLGAVAVPVKATTAALNSAVAVGDAFTNLHATSDASGRRFAVIGGQGGVVYDVESGRTTVIPQADIGQMAFTTDGVVTASFDVAGYRWKVGFWRITDGKAVRVPSRGGDPVLRGDGRLVVRGGTEVLAVLGDKWHWVSPAGASPQPLPFDALPATDKFGGFTGDPGLSTFVPRAIDERRNLLLHMNAAGRLAFSHLTDNPSQYSIVPITERRGDMPFSRLMTEASLSRFAAGEIITIDDLQSSVRVWKIPDPLPLAVPVPQAVDRQESLPCGSKAGVFCSHDRQWSATVSPKGGTTYQIDLAPTGGNGTPWSTTVEQVPMFVQVGAGASRILALHDDGFTFVEASAKDQRWRVHAPIKGVVFGPGNDRVTVLRPDNFLEVYDRAGIRNATHEWKVPVASSELTLVPKKNESSVLMFSRTWLHRLRPADRLNKNMARLTRKGQTWPQVQSVQTDAPIDLSQFREQDNDLVLFQGDRPVVESGRDLAAISAGSWSLRNWWRTITVDPCGGNRAGRPGTWGEKLCEWERIANRRTRDGLSR